VHERFERKRIMGFRFADGDPLWTYNHVRYYSLIAVAVGISSPPRAARPRHSRHASGRHSSGTQAAGTLVARKRQALALRSIPNLRRSIPNVRKAFPRNSRASLEALPEALRVVASHCARHSEEALGGCEELGGTVEARMRRPWGLEF
jgi:hypothetical protein